MICDHESGRHSQGDIILDSVPKKKKRKTCHQIILTLVVVPFLSSYSSIWAELFKQISSFLNLHFKNKALFLETWNISDLIGEFDVYKMLDYEKNGIGL